MTAGLETFAKVRALHDRATIPGEKLAAAGRMEALARSAGMSVTEALSKLDAAPTRPDLAAAARAWAERYEATAEAATRAADAPEALSRLRGLPIYDPNKVECWRDVAEHCLQLDWIIPKAHGGKFLTKAERGRLKKIAREFSLVTNATADWIESVLARCEVARKSWRDRGKAGVRPDHKATESDIEKAAELVAAAKRREASKLDTSEPKTRAQAMADSFADFFNTPEMRASFAEQDRKKQIQRAEILARYGDIEAVYAETAREAALRKACESFTIWDRRPDYEGNYTLAGWDWIQGPQKLPPEVREAVLHAWPLPQTVKAVWAEFIAADEHEGERHVMHDYEHFPALWSDARRYVLEDLLDTLPAASIGDMLARQSWMEHWSEIGARNGESTARLLATLRADIERMGERIREQDAEPVQSGHSKGSAQCAHPTGSQNSAQGYPFGGYPSRSPDPATSSAPVQSGHPRRTNADKRRDVLALIDVGKSDNARLTDREIARRAGVSPTTVGTIRRSIA